jgi:hypothetical protein
LRALGVAARSHAVRGPWLDIFGVVVVVVVDVDVDVGWEMGAFFFFWRGSVFGEGRMSNERCGYGVSDKGVINDAR